MNDYTKMHSVLLYVHLTRVLRLLSYTRDLTKYFLSLLLLFLLLPDLLEESGREKKESLTFLLLFIFLLQ